MKNKNRNYFLIVALAIAVSAAVIVGSCGKKSESAESSVDSAAVAPSDTLLMPDGEAPGETDAVKAPGEDESQGGGTEVKPDEKPQ